MTLLPGSPRGDTPGASAGQFGFGHLFGHSGEFLSGSEEIDNLAQLADYLVGHGFTKEAAAGVASTVGGESTGNPELAGSGGVGLIQWTPPSTAGRYGATFGGNIYRDMASQAEGLIRYGQARPGFDQLKSTNNAVQAAQLWSRMEAPAVAGSDERLNLIPQILAKMGQPIGGQSGIPIIGGVAGAISSFFQPLTDFVNFLKDIWSKVVWIFEPQSWLRILSAIGGAFLLILGILALLWSAADA